MSDLLNSLENNYFLILGFDHFHGCVQVIQQKKKIFSHSVEVAEARMRFQAVVLIEKTHIILFPSKI